MTLGGKPWRLIYSALRNGARLLSIIQQPLRSLPAARGVKCVGCFLIYSNMPSCHPLFPVVAPHPTNPALSLSVATWICVADRLNGASSPSVCVRGQGTAPLATAAAAAGFSTSSRPSSSTTKVGVINSALPTSGGTSIVRSKALCNNSRERDASTAGATAATAAAAAIAAAAVAAAVGEEWLSLQSFFLFSSRLGS